MVSYMFKWNRVAHRACGHVHGGNAIELQTRWNYNFCLSIPLKRMICQPFYTRAVSIDVFALRKFRNRNAIFFFVVLHIL